MCSSLWEKTWKHGTFFLAIETDHVSVMMAKKIKKKMENKNFEKINDGSHITNRHSKSYFQMKLYRLYGTCISQLMNIVTHFKTESIFIIFASFKMNNESMDAFSFLFFHYFFFFLYFFHLRWILSSQSGRFIWRTNLWGQGKSDQEK